MVWLKYPSVSSHCSRKRAALTRAIYRVSHNLCLTSPDRLVKFSISVNQTQVINPFPFLETCASFQKHLVPIPGTSPRRNLRRKKRSWRRRLELEWKQQQYCHTTGHWAGPPSRGHSTQTAFTSVNTVPEHSPLPKVGYCSTLSGIRIPLSVSHHNFVKSLKSLFSLLYPLPFSIYHITAGIQSHITLSHANMQTEEEFDRSTGMHKCQFCRRLFPQVDNKNSVPITRV